MEAGAPSAGIPHRCGGGAKSDPAVIANHVITAATRAGAAGGLAGDKGQHG